MSIKPSRNTARRDSRSTRSSTIPFESLESRVLLNGLTVITHGAQKFGGIGPDNRPGWVDTMGQQVAARYGGNTAVYLLRIEPNGNNVQANDPGSVADATNGNDTTQSNDQGQSAGGGDTTGNGAGDDAEQDQEASNSNETDQDADADATTEQENSIQIEGSIEVTRSCPTSPCWFLRQSEHSHSRLP